MANRKGRKPMKNAEAPKPKLSAEILEANKVIGKMPTFLRRKKGKKK